MQMCATCCLNSEIRWDLSYACYQYKFQDEVSQPTFSMNWSVHESGAQCRGHTQLEIVFFQQIAGDLGRYGTVAQLGETSVSAIAFNGWLSHPYTKHNAIRSFIINLEKIITAMPQLSHCSLLTSSYRSTKMMQLNFRYRMDSSCKSSLIMVMIMMMTTMMMMTMMVTIMIIIIMMMILMLIMIHVA